MPYTIRTIKSNPPKRRHCLVRRDGTIKQCHASRSLADRARRAIMMVEHGGKLTRQRGK